MKGRNSFYFMLALWAALYVTSFLSFAYVAPTGDGFTRGLNRLMSFLGWQAAAALAAVVLFVQSRAFVDHAGLRWLGRVPGMLALLLIAAIVALIVVARL